jgi:hypothetical protein
MSLEMKNKRYLVTHHMTYETFMYLVKKLKTFIKSRIIMFIKHRQSFGLVLCWFVHEVNTNITTNRINVKILIMHKYVDF